MSEIQLWATCWTSAGNASPAAADKRSPIDFRDRVENASMAGFTGMGFLYDDLVRAEAHYGLSGMASILSDNGIEQWETELLSDWWAQGPRRAASDTMFEGMLRFAKALHAREIKICPDDSGQPWSLDEWESEFARLCQRAADVGTRVAIEFLPWTNIKTAADALRLVEGAGHPAGGLIVDVWHTERAGTPAAELASIPTNRIVGVELSDADTHAVGTLVNDTNRNRRLCGEGSFHLVDDIRALASTGWDGPWGVEILSDDFRVLPVDKALAQAFSSTSRVLHAALDPEQS